MIASTPRAAERVKSDRVHEVPAAVPGSQYVPKVTLSIREATGGPLIVPKVGKGFSEEVALNIGP